MTTPKKLNLLHAHGLVQKAAPLAPHPFELAMFGNAERPVEVSLVLAHEVQSMMLALAPHVLALAEHAERNPGEQPDTNPTAETIAVVRSVFTSLVAKPPQSSCVCPERGQGIHYNECGMPMGAAEMRS